jgi:hypothetical protein
MRFSNIFQLPLASRSPAQVQLAVTEPAPASFVTSEPAALAAEPPDDLDQRVRLVGEWQLGEGY